MMWFRSRNESSKLFSLNACSRSPGYASRFSAQPIASTAWSNSSSRRAPSIDRLVVTRFPSRSIDSISATWMCAGAKIRRAGLATAPGLIRPVIISASSAWRHE